MSVTVKHTGKIVIDFARSEKVIASLILGRILKRTDEGKDAAGKPFADYGAHYRKALGAIREDATKVDMRLTGGMMNSIKHLRTVVSDGVITLFFGPGNGTSAAVRLPPPWITGNPEALARWTKRNGGRAKRTGKRGPSHARLMKWHEEGRGALPRRKILGMKDDRDGMAMLRRSIEKLGLFRGT